MDLGEHRKTISFGYGRSLFPIVIAIDIPKIEGRSRAARMTMTAWQARRLCRTNVASATPVNRKTNKDPSAKESAVCLGRAQ